MLYIVKKTLVNHAVNKYNNYDYRYMLIVKFNLVSDLL